MRATERKGSGIRKEAFTDMWPTKRETDYQNRGQEGFSFFVFIRSIRKELEWEWKYVGMVRDDRRKERRAGVRVRAWMERPNQPRQHARDQNIQTGTQKTRHWAHNTDNRYEQTHESRQEKLPLLETGSYFCDAFWFLRCSWNSPKKLFRFSDFIATLIFMKHTFCKWCPHIRLR